MSEIDSDSCGCTGDVGRAEVDPAYRRALWLVVILNIGFGIAELIGGFIADSQALKADALDFLGDGSITFVGLLALRWAESTRARVALTQGLFLGLLGISVLVMAAWRALNAIPPEAELMGGIGIAALAVNVIAALVLARFRKDGDAQARAIWLFSRNDAINNVACFCTPRPRSSATRAGSSESTHDLCLYSSCVCGRAAPVRRRGRRAV